MTRMRDVEFTGATGAVLAGTLHEPDTEVRGVVLLAHCFTCSKDLHTMTRLARALVTGGYAVLRFDFTGLGSSGGEFSDTTVTTKIEDLRRAAAALVELDLGPCAMVGHSLGGAATLLAAADIDGVRSVAVIGAPASPVHVSKLLVDHADTIRAEGVATVAIAGRPFEISADFLDSLDDYDQHARVAGLGRPLLVVHPVDDEVVPVAEGERIFTVAQQPKGFLPVLGADHLLRDRAKAAWVGQAITSWLDATR